MEFEAESDAGGVDQWPSDQWLVVSFKGGHEYCEQAEWSGSGSAP